jgi:hypothetical protein
MQGYSVLMPARPGLRLDDVADTIDSVLHFTGPETQLFLLDDTAGRDYQSLAERFSRVHLGATHFHDFTEVKPSSCGPLAVKQLRALEIIRNRQQSAVVLQLDTDALILGPNAFLDAQAIFGRNPAIGGLGAFTIPGDGSSKTEAMAGRRDDPVPVLHPPFAQDDRPPASAARARARTQAPARCARAYRYQAGFTCTARGLFWRGAMIDRWVALGFQRLNGLRFAQVGDDVLFGLLTYAAGYRLEQAPAELMAINYLGLSLAPPNAIQSGTRIIHSVEDCANRSEAELRERFARERHQPEAAQP